MKPTHAEERRAMEIAKRFSLPGHEMVKLACLISQALANARDSALYPLALKTYIPASKKHRPNTQPTKALGGLYYE